MPEPILKVLTKKSQLETSVTIHADMIPKCLLHEKNPSGNLLSSKTPSQDLEDRYVLDGLRIVKIIYHAYTFSRKSGLMRQN